MFVYLFNFFFIYLFICLIIYLFKLQGITSRLCDKIYFEHRKLSKDMQKCCNMHIELRNYAYRYKIHPR